MIVQVLQEHSKIPVNEISVANLVADFLAFHEMPFDEATIHYVDTSIICDLHAEYFDDPSTTDCITFPMDDADDVGYRVLGDIFVCPDTAADYVKENGGNLYHEITLYTVHGLLHCLGFDDIEEDERQKMRAEEARYLEQVTVKDLWLRK
ncbi:MAG TPA: rRNA maturation RNase YbeY [Parachlamydiaceae bacterium]|nr:rRNA maturation RNase YbeY [Parachlamydiaceae bacterium]